MMATQIGTKRGTVHGSIAARITRGLRYAVTGAALGLTTLLAPPATAQNQFAPAAYVDGEVITSYQLRQRTAFLTLLRAPGDIRQLAMDQLINETIQLREARRAEIVVDTEEVRAGIEEFAARGSLSADQLIQLLAQGGIAGETLRDFVAAGITWRQFVRETLLPQVSLSKAEIASAMAEAVAEPGLRVLLSEIRLPGGDAATLKASRARAARLTGLSEDEFSRAATRFSIAPSRNDGGKLNWLDVTVLPPQVGAAVRGLSEGKTSRIIEIEDEVRLYLLRDSEKVAGDTPATMVEYAALLLGGGRSDANMNAAAEIAGEVTSCDDFYPLARGLPPEQLIREETREGAVPAPYGAELAKLDPGEVSTGLVTQSGAMVVLMLCKRGNELPRSLTDDMVASQLRNSRVATLAQSLLDTLRANARIEIVGQ